MVIVDCKMRNAQYFKLWYCDIEIWWQYEQYDDNMMTIWWWYDDNMNNMMMRWWQYDDNMNNMMMIWWQYDDDYTGWW